MKTINTMSNAIRAGRILLPALSAFISLLPISAPANTPPARNSDFTAPFAEGCSPVIAKPVPIKPASAFAGMTCQNTPNSGMVAFDSAVAISRSGAQAIPVTGWRTLYQVKTPDTLRKLLILNPGRCPWELIGQDGIVREGVAEGAFVSFDPVTGGVVGVAVYQIDRAAQKEPQIARIGDNIILRGRFLVVTDTHHGRKIVQRGASEVHLNAQTGSVVATK